MKTKVYCLAFALLAMSVFASFAVLSQGNGITLTEPIDSDPQVLQSSDAEIAESVSSLLYSSDEYEWLACAIYAEAGGDMCCDLCRHRVGDVILNRVVDERYPSTIYEVLTQERQYGRFYWTGVVWPERSQNPNEAHAVERAYNTARELLSGEHSDLYGTGFVFQAEFPQGTDVIYCEQCHLYYGR